MAVLMGFGAMVAVLPTPDHDVPSRKLMPDQPVQAALYRGYQRLDENGKMAKGAIMKAVRQRADMARTETLRAGVSPSSWFIVGPPSIGGRVRSMVIDPTDPERLFLGSAGGGIFRREGGGFRRLDDMMPSLAISTLAMSPANPLVLYAGTGEPFFETQSGELNASATRGAGIFKSSDGGGRWFQIPSTDTPDFHGVTRIAICPTNPSLMLATTSTGVWRSADAGENWSKRLAVHGFDVDFHPTDPAQAVCGTRTEGVYTTGDGGLSWSQSPSISGLRTELAYARSDPSIVYASVSQNNLISIWRSIDGGRTFALRPAAAVPTYQAFNNTLWVDPTNSNNLIVGGIHLWRSLDGGGSRTLIYSTMHPDHHAIVEHPQFNGTTNRTVYFCNDGGLFRADDYLVNSFVSMVALLYITQYYGAAISPNEEVIIGGTQDNGTIESRSAAWTTVAGGDGGYVAYGSSFFGSLPYARVIGSQQSWTEIWNGANPIADANDASKTNFITSIAADPNRPGVIYVGCQRLWRTTNSSAWPPDWFAVKPPIEPARPGMGSASSPAPPANPINISTVTVAKGNPDVLWVGHNNGQIYKTVNGTAANPAWTRVDAGSGLPARWVSRIVVSPTDHNKVFVTFLGWSAGNIWKTTDGGATWSDISSGKIPDAPISAMTMHNFNPGWLYAGGDLGIFASMDDGVTWTATNQGPSMCAVEDFAWYQNTLYAMTHGRGIWRTAISGTTDSISPDSFSMPFGRLLFGVLKDVLIRDDVRMEAIPTFTGSRNDAQIQYEFTARSVHLTASVLAMRSDVNADFPGMEVAYAYLNHQTEQWEEVLRQPAPAVDTLVTSSVTNASRFISPTGLIRARIRFYVPSTAPRVVHGRVDVVDWKVTP